MQTSWIIYSQSIDVCNILFPFQTRNNERRKEHYICYVHICFKSNYKYILQVF